MTWFGPWLAPFVVLLVILFLYFYVGRGTRAGLRAVMRKDVNFYLVAVLATSIVAIFAGYRMERDWLDVAVWIIAAIAIAASVYRVSAGSTVISDDKVEDDRGPLERND